MNIKVLCSSAVLSISLAALSMATFADTAKPTAVDKIDIKQYAGKWYGSWFGNNRSYDS